MWGPQVSGRSLQLMVDDVHRERMGDASPSGFAPRAQRPRPGDIKVARGQGVLQKFGALNGMLILEISYI